MSDATKTLYERLGGYDAIAAVANDLLPRLRSDPQLGRFWAHRGEDGIMREKQLLIDFLCASAGGVLSGQRYDARAQRHAASVKAIGMCSSVMPARLWQSSRYPMPKRVKWSRLFRALKKNASNAENLLGNLSVFLKRRSNNDVDYGVAYGSKNADKSTQIHDVQESQFRKNT